MDRADWMKESDENYNEFRKEMREISIEMKAVGLVTDGLIEQWKSHFGGANA